MKDKLKGENDLYLYEVSELSELQERLNKGPLSEHKLLYINGEVNFLLNNIIFHKRHFPCNFFGKISIYGNLMVIVDWIKESSKSMIDFNHTNIWYMQWMLNYRLYKFRKELPSSLYEAKVERDKQVPFSSPYDKVWGTPPIQSNKKDTDNEI